MAQTDKRVDAYIARAAPFAQPILVHLRKLVHTACPKARETIKWGFPNFEYQGILCSMAAFKQHCAFNFWKSSLMKDNAFMKGKNELGMGDLGKVKSLGELPRDRKILAWISEAMRLNEENVKVPAKAKTRENAAVIIPEILKNALKKDPKLSSQFARFSPSHQKEYIEWINQARTEETRGRRLATALEWIALGKNRNWKYEKN